ncbi:hypothetical protein KDD30_23175 (plasmid) [Photobacterium sp. GJ3]|uniref:cyanobactin maturation protease PatG family protein n=1 Tax=Photobacterium sp. GJ3 TaxID=2829502 RepID=UPI001B8B9731|nr:hypothetical protein [Photobacterium sp. GJ3]QUJ69638.1 hypothetical protein KDD30_23175 [Photobacterium sp. GJ3]
MFRPDQFYAEKTPATSERNIQCLQPNIFNLSKRIHPKPNIRHILKYLRQRREQHHNRHCSAQKLTRLPPSGSALTKVRTRLCGREITGRISKQGLEKECEAAAQEISAKENRNVAPYQYGTIFGYIDKQPGSEQRTKPYRYLAENVNWILTVDEQEAYIIQPHSIVELNEFISYLRKLEQEQADQSTELLCVIVGVQEASRSVDAGEEIWLPVVQCNHIFDFDPNPAVILRKLGQSGENTTTTAIANLLNLLRVRQNLGASDFERAQNFLAFRYPDIYETRTSGMLVSGEGNHNVQKDTEAFLLSIETQYSPSAAETTLVDVIFNYQRTISGRQFSYFASVDVSSLYPFLQSPLSDYIPTHG